MAPSIDPLQPLLGEYTISDSAAWFAAFFTDSGFDDQRFFRIQYPAAATISSIVLRHVASGTDVRLDTLQVPDRSIPDRTITVTPPGASDDPKILTCTIDNTGAGGSHEAWELRTAATAPQPTWVLRVDDQMTTQVSRLICDPVAEIVGMPPTVLEKDQVKLVARSASVGTVVGTPMPSIVYRFAHGADVAMNDMPICGNSQTGEFPAPGVYAETQVPITLTVGFDVTCQGIDGAFLKRTFNAPVLTVRPRPQQIALVMDRSGSMALENRWVNAQASARLLTNLFAAFRENVHADDRIGILVFEDEAPVDGWHPPPVSTLIGPVLTPRKLDDAANLICGLNFGNPGQQTPLGDGLIAGIDMLITGGPNQADPDPEAVFTMIVDTDGFENTGTVQVGPQTPRPGIARYADARLANTKRQEVVARLNTYSIGLGSTIDEAVLNNLAAKGRYLKITDPSQLAKGFAEMLSVSQEVNAPITHDTPPQGFSDPQNPTAGTAVYFITEPQVNKLAVGVLVEGGTAVLEHLRGTEWVSEGPLKACGGHFFGAISDVPNLGETTTILWRVSHPDDAGARQALATDRVLPYVDLHLKADVVLDKPEYGTADKMRLTVRLRQDAQPITTARVRAVLDAPAVGVGEALSGLSAAATTSVAGGVAKTVDAPSGRGALIEAAMRSGGWKDWPHNHPTGLFVDGTDELHDADGDGNFTNTFARILKEGTYSWEFLVDGQDLQGNPFERRLLISTHAHISVDARETKVQQVKVPNHPSGMQAVRVIVTPQDRRGELLGPGFDNRVIWSLNDGTFENALSHQPAPVFADGTYQRVILFNRKQRPVLKVTATGTLLPTIKIDSDGGKS